MNSEKDTKEKLREDSKKDSRDDFKKDLSEAPSAYPGPDWRKEVRVDSRED